MVESARARVGGTEGGGRWRGRGAVWFRWGTTLALSVAVVGCSTKDQAKCRQALDVTRKSLKVADMNLAQRWRARAYTYCADPGELAKLDQDVVARRTALETERRQEEAKKTHAHELMALFVQWVGDHRVAPEGAAQSVTCGPEDKAGVPQPAGAAASNEGKKPRWCTRVRTVTGGYQLSVRYREDDTKVEGFDTISPAAVDCAALGANKILIKGPPRSYCEITSGRLQGMQALITNRPDGTHVDVFTSGYVQRDATIRALTR